MKYNFSTLARLICGTLVLLPLAACGPSGDGVARNTTSAVAAMDSGAGMAEMPGMAGMPGMDGMPPMSAMMSVAMMDSMAVHIGMMKAMGADSLKASITSHRQELANLISQMTAEMRDMNMTAENEWTTTIDSLRQDLVRLPDMGQSELRLMLPSHLSRIEMLIGMHRAMMGGK